MFDRNELESEIHFYPEDLDENVVFDSLADAGISMKESDDGRQLIFSHTSINGITPHFLDTLAKLYGCQQSKAVCVCFNVAIENTGKKFAIASNASNTSKKKSDAIKQMKTSRSSPRR